MKNSKKLLRQKGVLQRLETQLKSGVKPCKETKKDILLSDSDKHRIEREIEILKKRTNY